MECLEFSVNIREAKLPLLTSTFLSHKYRMAPTVHLRIGVFIPTTVQLLDLSPIDLLGMLDPAYLTACNLPSPIVSCGTPSTIHYISTPSNGTHMELTASASLKITKTILDSEVQPGMLDILLIPGPDPKAIFEEDVLAFLRGHVDWKGEGKKTDVLSVCTGVILLGQSGVLKGKTACGPRVIVPLFTKQFQNTTWEDKKRWVKDGNIWSSGEYLLSDTP